MLSFLALMHPRDTTAAAAQLQEEIHRQLDPSERLRMAMEMSEFARSLSKAGLRARRPELTQDEANEEMLDLMYGFRRSK